MDTINVSGEFSFSPSEISEAKSLQSPSNKKCPNPIGRLLRAGKFIKIACKSWKCPVCAKIKKFRMIKRFEHFCSPYVQYRMLTLTEWKSPDNHENSLQLAYHFHKLKASLRHHDIVLGDYFWVKEYKPLYNPDPNYTDEENALVYPHMHALVPASIDIELLSHLWFLATNETADHVHIPKELDPALNNPAAYITKYVTKSDMKDGFGKNERRFGFSRKYKPNNVKYKYLKNDVVKTFNPVPADGSGIFILNHLKASDVLWRQVEDFYNRSILEYYTAHPEDEFQRDLNSEHAELMLENQADLEGAIDSMMVDTEYHGDYVIDRNIPVRVSSPANVYAKEKVKFFIQSLSIAEKLKVVN